MSPRHHVLITGTGRAGTTFLIELLTHLGLETGFRTDEIPRVKDERGHAGLEHDIQHPDCPYIVKSPWFCDDAHQVIQRKDIVIDHIYIPVRDLHAAAESRRYVTRAGSTFGGLWHTDSNAPGEQEKILLTQVYKLVYAVSDTEIPVTFLRYPRLTKDDAYLYTKLKPVIPQINFIDFQRTFTSVVRPELVHRFNENDT